MFPELVNYNCNLFHKIVEIMYQSLVSFHSRSVIEGTTNITSAATIVLIDEY